VLLYQSFLTPIVRPGHVSEVVDQTGVSAVKGGVFRRSWSPVQKRRIVEEAYRPGALVADVARTHGLNAKSASLSTPLVLQGETSAAPAATFLPIGTIAPADDAGALLALSPTASGIGRAVSEGPSSAGPAMGGRA